MLRLRNICKSYENGKNKNVVLDNISLDFKKRELVFILGISGSGKSTLLNIIGGNLRSDSGDIFLDGENISKFKEKKLDNYRNKMIGNIFQDYNLIEYMSVIDNIMLNFNGIVDKIKILGLLRQLGILDKKNVIVNKLSGGEKQRVAIARALINNPGIILADEPTGALDSENGIKIMEILKRLSKNKLVIVVSHDNNLANRYADRIIKIKDGKVDYIPQLDSEKIEFVKGKRINRIKIFKLAFKNLWLKMGRTLFTALSISLGMLSMMIVLCLGNNFNREIDILEEDIVSVFPISIYNGEFEKGNVRVKKSDDKIIIKDKNDYVHMNVIDSEYMEYLSKIDEIKYMTYGYDMFVPIVTDSYMNIGFNYFEMIPDFNYIDNNYDLVSGRIPNSIGEVLLKIDSNNNVDYEILNAFSIDRDISYDEIIGRKMRVILNDDYYVSIGNSYVVNKDNYEIYNKSNVELVIVGVIKEKEVIQDNSGFLYQYGLIEMIFGKNRNSQIVRGQLNSDSSLLGNGMNKEDMLRYLGYSMIPSGINIYVDNLFDKEKVIRYLDEYNRDGDKIIYVDMMADTIEIVKDFINIIGLILMIFSLVSIVISSLMIGVLTNTRVVERRKEIGIFRSLGASRGDIVWLFNMENTLIVMISSVISIFLLVVINKPINIFIYNMIGLDNMFKVDYMMILGIILVNIFIVRLAAFIPLRKVSKMEITKCIYGR